MRDVLRLIGMFFAAVLTLTFTYGLGFVTALRVKDTPAVAQLAARVAPAAAPAVGTPADSAAAFDIYWEAWRHVKSEFYGEIPADKDVAYDAIKGSLRSLDDPFTNFSDPVTTQVNSPDLDGEFEGIGAFVTANPDGLLMIQTPMPGQPAERAGIRSGDIVIKVDGEDITMLDVDHAVLKIRGPKGTAVELTIVREGEAKPLIFKLVRERIEVPSVTNIRLLDKEGAPELGYLHITSFAEDTEDRLHKGLEELRAKGAKALVLDLRNDPGGYLETAIDVASEFIAEGVIVMQEDNSGKQEKAMARPGGRATDLPLVVLVNRGSASASEIVAGALRDHKRAIIVGETSFGKGSVQNVHKLSDNSELRVTIAAWLTPKGTKIHKLGIAPDVPMSIEGRPIDTNARDKDGRSLPEPTPEPTATVKPGSDATPSGAPDAAAPADGIKTEDLDGDGKAEPIDFQLRAAIAEARKLLVNTR
ncbi:MAG: S41 family peptidase [Ardenticatenia bacterium]|nr:S41 family peptidase [Ardenticatenia bacterium]